MELNTRPLRAADGSFHLGRVAREAGLRLCDFCDRRANDCADEKEEGCDRLVPALFFVPPHAGLDGQFSTFRPSAVWFERARVLMKTGQPVALIDRRTQESIGRASIRNAHRGPFWALMEKHAHTNHLCLDLPKGQAKDVLEAWIKTNMGSRYVKERDAICTVIDLVRIPH